MKKILAVVLTLLSGCLLSGCGLFGTSAYDLPLPGGADLGSHPITLSADFDNVLDLVPQSTVKVDHVDVGKVTKITLNPGGHTAHVELKVNGDVNLPVGTTARLKQTTLLGEKYVALIRPSKSASGAVLKSGARLGKAQTSEAATIEQVLGALSMLLNGGDIGKFQQISRELQKISTGRTGKIRDFLSQTKAFVTGLDARKEAITSALDGLQQLSATLDGEKQQIVTALDGLSPGMKVLTRQRGQLVAMLKALDRLSDVTVATLDASQEDIVADLKRLAPVLDKLADAGSDLPDALQILFTYPFPDSVLGAIKGDYLNVFITTNFRTPTGCQAMGCSWPQPVQSGGSADGSMFTGVPQHTATAPSLLPPTDSALPGVPSPTVTAPSGGASPTTQPSPSGSPTPSTTPSSQPSPTGSPTLTALPSPSAGSSPSAQTSPTGKDS